MPNTSEATIIQVRCPEWQYCIYPKCSHSKIHQPNTNCHHNAEGSIRPDYNICPPDCRQEGK